MKIIFVRHGHPNYKDDCLTELGITQADAAAERLKDEAIDKIFCSTNGRAYETAEHINKYHNKEITKLPFMRELGFMRIAEGYEDKYPEILDTEFGNPWYACNKSIGMGINLLDADWRKNPIYEKFYYPIQAEWAGEEFDKFLTGFGVRREGDYYALTEEFKNETILVASHGGSSSAVLAHLFNLPLPFVSYAFRPNFTSITVVEFIGNPNETVSPRITLFNDARHIEASPDQNKYH